MPQFLQEMIEKILLAEDNNMNRTLALHGLKQYKVDVAFNGQEAVDLFAENQYDIVIMDIQMPVVDGIEASRKMRKIELEKVSKRGTIILGMSADWFPKLMAECKEAGIDDFLSKPFRPKELPELLTGFYSKYTH
jgi:CheY-like chemotaxis protein